MIPLYKRALQDALTKPMILLALLPLLFGILIAYLSFGYIENSLLTGLGGYIDAQSFHPWLERTLEALLQVALWLGMAIYLVIVVVILQLFLGVFYAPWVVSYVQKRHYPHLSLHTGESLLASLVSFAKMLASFIFWLLLCLPLYFIPVIGGFLWLIPFYRFFAQSLMLDVAGLILEKEERIALEVAQPWELRGVLGTLYLLGLVPMLNLFTPLFQLLSLAHFLFQKREAISLDKRS